MGAAILSVSSLCARKPALLFAPPLASDLFYFRKATGALRE